MVRQSRPVETAKEKRERLDRRDLLTDRRAGDRREKEQRKGERRVTGRRTEFCPTCKGELTPKAYCSSCKIRVIKIRTLGGR